MEGKGWIRREYTATDRRIKRLDLTAAGQSVLQQVEPGIHRVQDRLLASLTAAEAKTLLHLLGVRPDATLRDRAGRVAGEAVVAGADGGRHRGSDCVLDVPPRRRLDPIGCGFVQDGQEPVQHAVQGDERRRRTGIVDISLYSRAAPPGWGP